MVSVNLPPGWLTDAEAKELQRLARGRTVLELGAWKGRSTVVLAQVAKYVISVDRHQGIEGHGESFSEYFVNISHLTNVAAVISDFQSFVPFLRKIDMVYIDGDHDAASVERDTGLAFITEPSIIAFHDWDFPEVREGAGKVMLREPDGLVGSVASYEFE